MVTFFKIQIKKMNSKILCAFQDNFTQTKQFLFPNENKCLWLFQTFRLPQFLCVVSSSLFATTECTWTLENGILLYRTRMKCIPLSCCQFWIYGKGVNTRITTVSCCKSHAPSKLKILHDTFMLVLIALWWNG